MIRMLLLLSAIPSICFGSAGLVGEESLTPSAAPTEYTVYITDNTVDFNSVDYSEVTVHTGSEDSAMREGITSFNYGGSTALALGLGTGSDIYLLEKFSGLSNIPASATVTSIEFGVRVSNAGGAMTWTAHRLLRDWVEGTQTGAVATNDTPDSVCWTYYGVQPGSAWTTGGALGDGTDRATVSSGSFSNGSSAAWHTIITSQMMSDVQDFIDGTSSNYGWTFDGSGADNWADLVASEGTDGSRPYLKVVYED